jgi:hypothetical protein
MKLIESPKSTQILPTIEKESKKKDKKKKDKKDDTKIKTEH